MKAKQFLSFIICLVLTVLMIHGASVFLARRGSHEKNADFYDRESSHQILFLGSSRMVQDIAPMELWNTYGFTSYNMANYGQYLPVDYWVLRNALDHQTPELVVMDTTMIDADNYYYEMFAPQFHEMFDSMPWSRNKFLALKDILPPEKRMEFMWPFSLYHTRWSSVDKTFFSPYSASAEKGAHLDANDLTDSASFTPFDPPVLLPLSSKNNANTVGKQYLFQSIELCKENNIDVLLVSLPSCPDREEQAWQNSIRDVAGQFNVLYHNMYLEQDCINYQTDLIDEGHLNSSGTRKATNALGQFISAHYPLADLRESPVADKWNKDYAEYCAFKIQWMKQQTSLDSYLITLSQEPFFVEITVREESVLNDTVIQHLLENILDYTIQTGPTSAESHIMDISVKNVSSGELIDAVSVASDGTILRQIAF